MNWAYVVLTGCAGAAVVAGVLAYGSSGQGSEPPAVIFTDLVDTAEASGPATEAEGIRVTVTGGDSAGGYVSVEFAFVEEPAEETLLVVDVHAVEWDGMPAPGLQRDLGAAGHRQGERSTLGAWQPPVANHTIRCDASCRPGRDPQPGRGQVDPRRVAALGGVG